MAHALQNPSNMTNTQAFASIDINTLSDVQGGCGGRRHCRGGCGTKNVSIVNNYAAAPAAAPAPAPSGGNSGVSVSVGYGQA